MSKQQRILVVDDEDSARLLMRIALEKCGFAVSLAVDGYDALRQFRTTPFDMIMLDVDMLGMDGYQVCAAMREEVGDELPIVMVTGKDDMASIQQAYEVKATDFISKPINWALIGHRVKYLLRSYLTRRELNMANAQNAALLEAIPDLMFEVDLDGRILGYHSPRRDLLVVPPDEFLGRTIQEMLPPDAAGVCLSAMQEANESGFSSGKQYDLLLPKGKCWFELSVSRKSADTSQSVHFIALARDITKRMLDAEQLQLAASVFTHAREGIMITDASGRIIDVNEAFTNITGFSRDAAQGQNAHLLVANNLGNTDYATLWSELTEKGHWNGELWNRRENGEVYASLQAMSAVRDAKGIARHYVTLFSDITPLKEHERQLERIAHYDALTGLPNRALLADRLRQAMAQEPRRGQRLAVAYLDLDGFKEINDAHGHEAGDQFLRTVASRMKQTLREGDTLARLGGDEFVVVLLDLTDIADSLPMLTRLLVAAAQPVRYGNCQLIASASLGVTFYPQVAAVDADQLLRQADQAMYQAKLAGKNRYHLFDFAMDSNIRGHT